MNKSHGNKFYCIFFVVVFSKIFITSWDADWRTKFTIFGVPAMTYPGGDARNIQMSAYCSNFGNGFFEKSPCFEQSLPVKRLYPEANIPAFNYPSIWPRCYAFFNDYSEKFFRKFWTLNAILFLATVSLLAVRFNHKVMPLVLFNPVTLLTIERGNIDASVFFFTFMPLLIWRSQRIIGFSLASAAALKIFPAFGYIAFFKNTRLFWSKRLMFGAALVLPVLVNSILEFPAMIRGTSKGFSISYGLASIFQHEYIIGRSGLGWGVLFICMLFYGGCLYAMHKNSFLSKDLKCFWGALNEGSMLIIAVSSCIYLFTFLCFTNWAYRLIFLIPAFFIVSSKKTIIEVVLFWLIFVIFWIPVLPYGWVLISPLCYLLFLPMCYMFTGVFVKNNDE